MIKDPSIPKYFANPTDPRRENKRHKLIDIITIAICAVICNADSFAHIYEFGQAKQDWFKKFLELPHGIPSTDTFERVFARIDPKEFNDVTFIYHETTDAGHGKIEIRKYWTLSDIDWLQGKQNWKNLTTICMVERERQFENKTENETSYYIGSVENNAKAFAHAVRSHWSVENSLHWVLDVSFREDESRIRKDHAPDNFAVLKHIALNMIKKETSVKKSIKAKRLRAGWDDNYLLKVLNA